MFNIILKQTLLYAITQVQRATKISVDFVRNYPEDETWLKYPSCKIWFREGFGK